MRAVEHAAVAENMTGDCLIQRLGELRRERHAIYAVLNARLQGQPVGVIDALLLLEVGRAGSIRPSVLREALLTTDGSISSGIRQLLTLGFLSEGSSTKDRRVRLYSLSEAGQVVVRQIQRVLAQTEVPSQREEPA